jgi:uncharacterized protein (TIGR00255 family)
MSLKSMTGFARTAGHQDRFRWSWEIKAVNAKGLDLRLRVPPGFDQVEAEARTRLAKRLARGTCYATLTLAREAAPAQVRINRDLLQSLLDTLATMPTSDTLKPASMDGLLAVRGIVEVSESADDEAALATLSAAMLKGLDAALDDLIAARLSEGAALQKVLSERVETISALAAAAEAAPGRKPEAVRARLQQAIDALTGASPALDPARLHQEAVLIAAKADVREELDRLKAHVVAARELLASDQPVGRKLDFLAQEFSREANTLCAKSNDPALSATGMDLRVEIEQLREQVQNIE